MLQVGTNEKVSLGHTFNFWSQKPVMLRLELPWQITFTNLCRGFKQECPDGKLNIQKIKEMYQRILPLRNPEVM